MLIRVRSNVGVWRIDGLNEATASLTDLQNGIAAHRPDVVYEQPLSLDAACREPIHSSPLTLADQGLTHGSMVFCRVDPSTCAEAVLETAPGNSHPTDGATATTIPSNMRKVIGKDGSIQMVQREGIDDSKGFRKGMMPLRDMKMQWTLNDFVALDSQFEFKIKRQEEAISKGVSLDTNSVNDFQSYLRRFNFSRQRCGYLYGTFSVDNKVLVEAIYEPPQEADPDSAEGFILLDDPKEDTVEQLAQLLGLRKVGWIIGHPPREEGFVMSAAEVILAAELQLEAAGGVEETPFVTVKVTVDDNGHVHVEAFQVSQQCMAMVAEEALHVGPNPGFCVVDDTFTAIQEGKESKTVENNFFLAVVPIVQHTSELLVSQFPKLNREHDDRTPSKDELKRQLSKSGTSGWTFVDLVADFNLLIFLSDFLDLSTDMPKICESIVNRQRPLDEGYKLIIAHLAGFEGSY
jgi:nuclear protein localization family protein 4